MIVVNKVNLSEAVTSNPRAIVLCRCSKYNIRDIDKLQLSSGGGCKVAALLVKLKYDNLKQ